MFDFPSSERTKAFDFDWYTFSWNFTLREIFISLFFLGGRSGFVLIYWGQLDWRPLNRKGVPYLWRYLFCKIRPTACPRSPVHFHIASILINWSRLLNIPYARYKLKLLPSPFYSKWSNISFRNVPDSDPARVWKERGKGKVTFIHDINILKITRFVFIDCDPSKDADPANRNIGDSDPMPPTILVIQIRNAIKNDKLYLT